MEVEAGRVRCAAVGRGGGLEQRASGVRTPTTTQDPLLSQRLAPPARPRAPLRKPPRLLQAARPQVVAGMASP